MIEFGVGQFQSLQEFAGTFKPAIGSKPCFVLDGALWRTDERIAVIGNLIVDFFRGQVLKKVNLAGLDHVIVLTAPTPDAIYFRHYAITLKKSGTKVIREFKIIIYNPPNNVCFVWFVFCSSSRVRFLELNWLTLVPACS
jgi:ribosome production factor 2